jgi:putative FmdB family regulatory protein
MPLYTYKCKWCDRQFDVVRKIAEMEQTEPCTCGDYAQKIIVPTAVFSDYETYSCPITGKPIEGKKAHLENLRAHGCRIYEPGETSDFIKRKAERERAFTRRTEEIVEKSAREIGLIR